MSDSERTPDGVDAWANSLVANRRPRGNAGNNLQAMLAFERARVANAPNGDDASSDYAPWSGSSDGSFDPDHPEADEGGPANEEHPHREQQALNESEAVPSSAQEPDATPSGLGSATITPLHPALMALAQSVRAFRHAGRHQEADIFRTWTLTSFERVHYSRALDEMEALPEHTNNEALVEFAEKALMRAEDALRERGVDGISLDGLRAQIEKYVESKGKN